LLIILGGFFLLGQVFRFNFFGSLWPFLIIAPGLAFLYAAINGDKRTVGLAVPGAIITGVGGILLYQNTTGHWESWAYVWILIPVFLGLSLMYMGRRTDNQREIATGRGFVKFGLMAFVGFWLLFEMFIFNGMGGIGRYLIPALLIGVGIYLLWGRRLQGDNPVFSGPVIYKRKNVSLNGHDPLRKKIDEALDEIDRNK
jgi:hypothetical protein